MSTKPHTLTAALRAWFAPPRSHGEVLEERQASPLELFYDLVYVVIIAQISHTLAKHPDWEGFGHFAIVFSLVWVAWLNGTYYHDYHGRDDGSNRVIIFTHMLLLVVLAVFAAHAADDADDGRGFSITYSVLFAVIALQWLSLYWIDNLGIGRIIIGYSAAMWLMAGIMVAASIVESPEVRLGLWAGVVAIMIAGMVFAVFGTDPQHEEHFAVTEALAERFALLTIIVLGEVVVGVVNGMSEGSHGAMEVGTGLLLLNNGFAFWWNIFDFVGRKAPRPGAVYRMVWTLFYLPLWLCIAAAGAGMVPLVQHATDDLAPTGAAWLVTGATAGMLLSLSGLVLTMPTHPGIKFTPFTLVFAAALALVVGAMRPMPIVLAACLNVILSLPWLEAFVRHARAGIPLGFQAELHRGVSGGKTVRPGP